VPEKPPGVEVKRFKELRMLEGLSMQSLNHL